MAVLSLSNAHLAFGHVALLDGAAFSLESGERLALIGRNGTGKSSLMKILAGLEKVDDGLLQVQGGLRRVYVPQEPVFTPGISVFDAVAEGVAEARALRQRYEEHRADDDLDALPWDAILPAAIASDDEHVIKLVDSCREQERAYGGHEWRLAASRAVK